MAKYSVGDHVCWNSEAGRVSGKIIKVHYQDFECKGYRHRASKDAPQYEIKSDKSDHIATHKESALTKIHTAKHLAKVAATPDQAQNGEQ